MSLGRQKKYTITKDMAKAKMTCPLDVFLNPLLKCWSKFLNMAYSVTVAVPEAVFALMCESYMASHLTAGRMYSPW